MAFGQGADFEFLRKLSLSNAGFARNIYVASDTTLQLKNFYKEVASPLLSNVTFEYVPGQVSEQVFVIAVHEHFINIASLILKPAESQKNDQPFFFLRDLAGHKTLIEQPRLIWNTYVAYFTLHLRVFFYSFQLVDC